MAETRTNTAYRLIGKRVLDLVASILLLPIVLPAIGIFWFLTVLDGGNGFYAQPRIGRNGREFRCWKIRTMVPNAELALKSLLEADPQIAAEWADNQKLARDPRVTRLGRLMRKTSVDELPQIWNVIKGEMSLIGPRPFTPDQKALYDSYPNSGSYYQLRPGISGLWQVEARNDTCFGDRVGFDDAYYRSLSLSLDIKIAFKTINVICRATGK